jgi:dTDP-4-dehydrorhamnose 3,5-epimerase-like enzyme
MSLAEADEFLRSPTYPIVTLEPPFVDKRGAIQNLTTSGAKSVAIITSKAGTERASHVHKTDDHLAFVISGRIEYWWQDVVLVDDITNPGRKKVVDVGELKHVVVEAGQAFYTPRHVAHTMHFLEDTTFATISCQSRNHADHEADLIRVLSLKAAR